MKLPLVLLVLTLFLSCVSENDPGPDSNTYHQCTFEGETNCVKVMDWSILVKKYDFPKYVSIILDNKVIKNECSGILNNVTIKRDAVGKFASIQIDKGPAAKSSTTVSLEIKNLGDHCNDSKTYYFQPKQSVEVIMEDEARVWVEI